VQVDVAFPDHESITARSGELSFKIGLPPDEGGDPDAYGPFDLLLSALALCTGHHVRAFLQQRGFPISDAGLIVRAERGGESHMLETVTMEVRVPEDFPQKYEDALVRAMGLCLIRMQLGRQPDIQTVVVRG
jgi:ribosomal protein S12 methylthiotransferase accessory factor